MRIDRFVLGSHPRKTTACFRSFRRGRGDVQRGVRGGIDGLFEALRGKHILDWHVAANRRRTPPRSRLSLMIGEASVVVIYGAGWHFLIFRHRFPFGPGSPLF
jgi:hypothetical protein